MEVVGQIRGSDRGLDGDHAATDVHAHGRGDDRRPGGDDRTDRRSEPEVRIRQEHDVAIDHRERGGSNGLRGGGLVEDRGPGQDVVRELLGHPRPYLETSIVIRSMYTPSWGCWPA